MYCNVITVDRSTFWVNLLLSLRGGGGGLIFFFFPFNLSLPRGQVWGLWRLVVQIVWYLWFEYCVVFVHVCVFWSFWKGVWVVFRVAFQREGRKERRGEGKHGLKTDIFSSPLKSTAVSNSKVFVVTAFAIEAVVHLKLGPPEDFLLLTILYTRLVGWLRHRDVNYSPSIHELLSFSFFRCSF